MKEDIPFLVVAAMFQKDFSLLIVHPGQGNGCFEAVRGNSHNRPYTFNLAEFLTDKHVIQQGYLDSEPFSIKEATGVEPVVLLLANAGFSGYRRLIATSRETTTQKADFGTAIHQCLDRG